MGKSEGNSVWLDPELTSPYDFYQYWINVDDADVERLLRLYTFLPESRIEELTAPRETGCARRSRRWPARSRRWRTVEAAATAARGGNAGACSVAPRDVDDPNIPTTEIAQVKPGLCPSPICSSELDSSPSRGEARRKAAEGALWMDGERLTDVDAPFQPSEQRHAAPLRQETLSPRSHRALTQAPESSRERSVAQAGDGVPDNVDIGEHVEQSGQQQQVAGDDEDEQRQRTGRSALP